MVKSLFYINDEPSTIHHISLQKPLEISGLEPIVKKIHVPGRNGDLILETGAYKNRKAKAKCYIANTNPTSGYMPDVMDDAFNFILQNDGYVKLRTAEDITHYFMARIAKGPAIAQRKRLINPAVIEWDCKPQRFCRSGDKPITYTKTGVITINNPGSGTALPIFKFYGSGYAGIRVGNESVYIRAIKDEITIDCDIQDAYSGTPSINRNSDIILSNGRYPRFLPGDNQMVISGSNVTKIEVIPRWWDK